MSSKPAKPILGYWDFRGIAEPIRYLLHFKKVDFEDRQYAFDFEDWDKDRSELDLDFPSLPYYIDEDVELSHSIVILRHLARKYDLDGRTEEEKIKVLLLEQESVDLRASLTCILLSNDYEILKKAFLEDIPAHFKNFDKFLEGKNYLMGDDITYVDFMAFESLDFYTTYHGTALDDFKALKDYLEKMKTLPELEPYVKSKKRKFERILPRPKFEGTGPKLVLKKPLNA